MNAFAEANALARGLRRLAASGPGSWVFARVLHHLDRPVYRATRGRIASNYGRPRHPAWYHNLRADPAAEIAVDGARTRVRALEVDGERRAGIWEQGLAIYPGWSTYERRASNRRIAVFVLEPH